MPGQLVTITVTSTLQRAINEPTGVDVGQGMEQPVYY